MRSDFTQEIDPGNLSDEDIDAYLQQITEAFEVHVERELKRHGLWKQYPALDQVRQIDIKAERVLNAISLHDRGLTTEKEFQSATLEELDDIINYAVFAKRIIKGEFGG